MSDEVRLWKENEELRKERDRLRAALAQLKTNIQRRMGLDEMCGYQPDEDLADAIRLIDQALNAQAEVKDELERKLEIAKRALREINSHYSMTNEFSQSLAEDALKEIER